MSTAVLLATVPLCLPLNNNTLFVKKKKLVEPSSGEPRSLFKFQLKSDVFFRKIEKMHLTTTWFFKVIVCCSVYFTRRCASAVLVAQQSIAQRALHHRASEVQ
jgi:hypothetical protein